MKNLPLVIHYTAFLMTKTYVSDKRNDRVKNRLAKTRLTYASLKSWKKKQTKNKTMKRDLYRLTWV